MQLSLITINYNNREGLKKTIDSVVAQTFKDFEWIVIDGGSTDGSRELLEQYAEHFAYWVSEPDKGIYNAMNKGIDHAQGDYLQFLNSGDWLNGPDTLQSFFAISLEGDIVYGDQDYYKGDTLFESRKQPDNLSLKYLYEWSLGHSSSFIKRELLAEEHYNENYRIVSDWEFFLKKAIENKSFVHRPITVGCFDMSGISMANQELLHKERESVAKTVLPLSVRNDFEMIDGLESRLQAFEVQMDKQLQEVCQYRSKKKLNRKLLNLYLRIVKLFG